MLNFSYWEKKYLKAEDSIVIIGSGIVGISTALALKEDNPDKSVIVIDRKFPPLGASTKNAGFLCFGSYSEVMSDLNTLTYDECKNLIHLRWQGGQLLRSRIPEIINLTGGYELFDKDMLPNADSVERINQLFFDAIGIENYIKPIENKYFKNFDSHLLSMPHEGMLDPMRMIDVLFKKCLDYKVKFIFGHEVLDIDQNQNRISFEQTYINYQKCIVCTNGFSQVLLPHLDVHTVRNIVMITKPINNLKWNGVFHYDEGYYYFRNVGKQILIGGARNLDPIAETTSEFGINEEIENHLKNFLEQQIVGGEQISYDASWSGILGIGQNKTPIIEKISENLYAGVRLGGMGVAIGSIMGKKLAELTKDDHE